MTLGDALIQYPSCIITASTAFAFLWLALYIFRVNPEDGVSRLASGVMVVIFFYLLGNFMVDTATSASHVVVYRRALWWLPFAPVLWLHFSQKTTEPLAFRGIIRSRIGRLVNSTRTSAVLGAFYGAATLFFLSGIFTNSLFDLSAIHGMKLPIMKQSIPTGPIYTLLTIFIFLVTLMAWINLLSQWWKDSKENAGNAKFLWQGINSLAFTGIPFYKTPYRSQFWWLGLAGILFWIASTGLLVSVVSGIKTDFAIGNMILGLGVLIVAVAVLKHNALLKKEALKKDAIYVSIGALGISAIYAIAIFISQGSILNAPISGLVLITALALTTHMLADFLKIWFSRSIGMKIGLFTAGEVDEMKQLYHEASRVKRRQKPVVELFDDENKTVEKLLGLLTPRQREIITLRAKGLSDKQIADSLDIKLPTVRKHIEDIKNRIGSRDKADCAVYCVVTGLLSKEDLVDWFDSLQITENNS